MGFLTYFYNRDRNAKAQKLTEDESWIYELVYEHMTSPIWKIAISEFIDDNCMYFDEENADPNEQREIHRKFINLISQQFDSMVEEFQITEEQLTLTILQGLQHPKHKPIFQQIIAVKDYLIFHKSMVKRNKELELEALQELEKQDQLNQSQQYQQDDQLEQQQFEVKRLQIEKEKTELELAIELSKKTEEEQRRLQEQNDEEFRKIVEKSLQEYNQNIKKLSVIIEQENELKKQPQFKQSEMLRSIKNVKYPSFTSFMQKQQELDLEKRVSEEAQQHNQNQDLSYIPPVIAKVTSELIEEPVSDILNEQKQKIYLQKEAVIKKRNENLKSELLLFQQGKQQQNPFQTQYQYE